MKYPRLVITRPVTKDDPAITDQNGKPIPIEQLHREGVSVATKCRDIDTGEIKSCEAKDNNSKLTFFVQKVER